MAISQVGFSNTFSQWLVATNQTITDLNKLETGNYTKLANTFTITSTGTAFQVTSGTSVFSAPVNITSTLTVDNTTTLKNTVNITASGSPLNVSNTAIIGAIQVARDSTFSANISANGQIISTKAPGIAPFIITSNTVSANLNADLLNGFRANTANSSSTIVARGSDGSITGYKYTSTAATGVAPLVVASTTLVANLNADLLDGYNSSTANSSSTVVIRNTVGDIEGNILKSNVATGSAPLVVASTTKVTNLNADLLDGFDTNTANSASTVVVRNASGDIFGNVLNSSVTGSAPLVVASTTKVTNLNADLLDGFDSSYFAANTENERISGQWTFTQEILGTANAANKLATARWFNFSGDVAGSGSFDGTANTNVTLTVQPNSIALGTDTTGKYVGEVKVSGTGLSISNTAIEGGDFTVTSNAASANGSGTLVSRNTSGDFAARVITLEAATGVAPFTISSTTVSTNLNADLLDGYHASTANSASTVVVRGTDGSATGYKFISTAATGVAPFTVSSTTVSTNLNADLLDGYHVGTSGSTIPVLNAINTWSANQIINGNLNVSGDLNISGNTIFSGSTINDSGDYLLRSNTGSTSSPDSTFTVKRNASPSTTANNAVIKWDNTALSWKMNDVSTNSFYSVLIDKPLQTITGTWTFNNEIKSAYSALNSFNLITATTSTNQVVASVLAKSAEFLIQANTGASSFHTTKLLAMHDGTSAYITEYGTIMNGSSLATYDCDISGGNLRLLVTPVNAVTTFKVSATYIN